MKPDRIGPVGGAGREDPDERIAAVVARVHLAHVTIRFMQPRENHNLLPGLDPVEAVYEIGSEFEPRIRCSLPALFWRVGALQQEWSEPRQSEESRSYVVLSISNSR